MRTHRAVHGSTFVTFVGALALVACDSTGGDPGAIERKAVVEPSPPHPPPPPPGSLADEELPPIFDRLTGNDLVSDLIVDEDRAVALGKALFWDMQAGSDGQACASCHFTAGADPRARNQLSPGPAGGDGTFDATRSGSDGGPNYLLEAGDFPFHVLADPQDRDSAVLFDTDDVASSQGVVLASFTGVTGDGLADACEEQTDEPFQVDGLTIRRVEPRNSPTVINAAFNFRNFWDGRANNLFNGVDPFGRRNPDAFVLEVDGGSVVQRKLELVNASLASQAVGPLLSDFEMSCAGRGFRHAARKLLAEGRRPLAFQQVASDDSVLGPLAVAGGTGLTTTYAELIQQAFASKLWDSGARFDAQKQLIDDPGVVPADQQYTLMESNFSLFWGLAIQAYERTLVSDDSPFDKYRDGRDPDALGEAELAGFDVFLNQGKCVNCHGTAMFTKASTLHLLAEDEEGGLVERMSMSEEHFHYAAITNQPITVYASASGKKQVAGARSLSFAVEATPRLLKGKLVPGVAEGSIALADGNETCTYAPSQLTLGADKSNTRDVTITAGLVGGSDCVKKIQLSFIDDAELEPGEWIDLVQIQDPQGRALFTGSAAAGSAVIREPALYDNGFYNIGVRPTAEDLGVGGTDPFGHPLSFTAQFVRTLLGEDVPDPFEIDPCRFEVPWNITLDGVLFPGGFVDATSCGGTLAHSTGLPADSDANQRFIEDLRTAVRGAFKTPTLRNVQLTAPYMHNGGMATLEQVVEFYDRGGNFHGNRELDPDITRLELSAEQRADLVRFLESLTDPDVVYERAPFDHPQLIVPNGLATVVDIDPEDGVADEHLLSAGLVIPAVGAGGRSEPVSTFLGLEDADLPPEP